VKQIPYELTNGHIKVVIGGKTHFVFRHDNPQWQQANAALADKDWKKFASFFSSPKSTPTHEYEFHEFIKDIAIIHEKADEGWRVHTILRNGVDTFTLLFERKRD
jgi:hypothetical protein